jgi:uncharacterized protein (TIGR03086 family)
MEHVDLEPAARRMADLLGGIDESMLDRPTPCADTPLAALLDHVSGLSLAFTSAATKDTGGASSQPPSASADNLGDDWRTRIPWQLEALARAWRDPEAWTGMTKAGGIDLPGEVAGLVALDELVIHAWDVARASGQPFECDPASLDAVHGFVSQFSGPGQEEARQGLFGPEVDVPDDAPLLDRVIGMTGRDPAWRGT